ncbi:MAG: methionyl-tRNA formyltransferase [Bacteroidota bacterium]
MPLRIVFMGTAEFAIPTLNILLENGYSVPVVVTSPDKPKGRGQELLPTPVKQRALEAGLTVLQPENLRDPSFADSIRSCSPDLIVVVAFRILPKEVFTIPRLGSMNLHASLLPKYRGAAPINRAIMNGEKETGVTTFLLDEKVDTGKILLQARAPIFDSDDAGTVHDKLAEIGAQIVLHSVRLIEQGKAVPRPQDDTLATPAPKIFKEDCRIDWNRPAEAVRNQIRGLSPSPAAFTTHEVKVIKIFRASVVEGKLSPGAVQAGKDFLHVGTGDKLISIEELQQEGKRRMTIAEFLRGYRLADGERLGIESEE